MAVDMVYDIFKKHNPMLSCVAEGHGILECSAIYQGLNFYYAGNDNCKNVLARNPYYKIGHAAGKDNIVPPKIIFVPHKTPQKNSKPFRGPVFIPNYSRDGLSVHYKRIDWKRL